MVFEPRRYHALARHATVGGTGAGDTPRSDGPAPQQCPKGPWRPVGGAVAVDETDGALYAVWMDARFDGGRFLVDHDNIAFTQSTDGGRTRLDTRLLRRVM